MSAGWRWRIPLAHRVGNGYVYSSAHLDDDHAADALLAVLETPPLADPRVLRFRAGRRRHSWARNVVAIGLASGFLEPLESTSIYLAQAAIMQMIALFPVDHIADGDRAEFNRLVDYEYDRVRDFLVLHYHATMREDSDFWNDMRTMTVPDSLIDKIELFRRAGRIERYSHGLFLEPSWVAVYVGQGIVPERWDQRADAVDPHQLAAAMTSLRQQIREAVGAMPHHRQALAR
jgi:tryptophan halogenase